MKFIKYSLLSFSLVLLILFLIPEQNYRETTQELAVEANINPKLADFILHTKLGRKVGFLFVKKTVKKKMNPKNWFKD